MGVEAWAAHGCFLTQRSRQLQVSLATVTRDGNMNIHVQAVSSFLAAEGNMSCEAHCMAQKTLAPRTVNGKRTWEGTLCVVDGAPALAEAATKHFPGVQLGRCRNHFRDKLLTTERGRRDIPIYEKLICVPQGQKGVAERIYRELPADSPIRDVPEDQLCDAYLPPNVHSNGVKLNNFAEQFNAMTSCASRPEGSLFRSMVADENLIRERLDSLNASCLDKKKSYMGLNTPDADLAASPWPPTAVTPNVELEVHAVRERSRELHAPKVLAGSTEADPKLSVQSSTSNARYKVQPASVLSGRYMEACQCGLVASSKVTCKHLQKSIRACRRSWQTFVKSFQQPERWQRACTRIPPPPDYAEMAEDVFALSLAGELHQLKQPNITIGKRGRPKDMGGKKSARIKSFLEMCSEKGLAEDEAQRVLSGTSGARHRILSNRILDYVLR